MRPACHPERRRGISAWTGGADAARSCQNEILPPVGRRNAPSFRRGTALLLAAFLAACAPTEFSEPPEVTLTDLRPLDVSLMEQRLAVGLRIRNLNDVPMSVNGLRFTLELNGKAFAKGAGDQSVTVPRLSEAETEGIASIATTDLIRQLAGLPEAKGMGYRISGVLFLSGPGRRSLPFDAQGEFDLFSSSSGSKIRGLNQ